MLDALTFIYSLVETKTGVIVISSFVTLSISVVAYINSNVSIIPSFLLDNVNILPDITNNPYVNNLEYAEYFKFTKENISVYFECVEKIAKSEVAKLVNTKETMEQMAISWKQNLAKMTKEQADFYLNSLLKLKESQIPLQDDYLKQKHAFLYQIVAEVYIQNPVEGLNNAIKKVVEKYPFFKHTYYSYNNCALQVQDSLINPVMEQIAKSNRRGRLEVYELINFWVKNDQTSELFHGVMLEDYKQLTLKEKLIHKLTLLISGQNQQLVTVTQAINNSSEKVSMASGLPIRKALFFSVFMPIALVGLGYLSTMCIFNYVVNS